MHILIVGGGGYIGSHMLLSLAEQGHSLSTLDNFSTGYRDAIKAGELIEGDLADRALLNRLFCNTRIDAVIHFASFIQVGESVLAPAKYYRNNVSNTINLLDAMVEHAVPYLVFSSSAAVYGEPDYSPLDEAHPKRPLNPYGLSKWMVEQILADYDRAYGLRSVCLRYFNAAGADPQTRVGERHAPETHLIPLILQAALGQRDAITVYGRDYDTSDGTCIRDYIHVSDLCSAHAQALNYLEAGGRSAAFNLGNGAGYSVQQVIAAAQAVTGNAIPILDGARRAGDPARLVADATLARTTLQWQPQRAALETIIGDAWQWLRRRPAN